MMKQLFSLCFLLILAGCTESSFEGNHPISGNEEFYATFEDTDSRTYVDEQIRMRWNAEDEITIFKKNTYNRTFMFTGNTGANAGGFRQVSTDEDYWFGYDVDYSYAVYPHSAENALDETDLYLTVNMPAEQTYAENSFGLNSNTMVAVSESNQLIFKNVGSYLHIRLYGANVAVSSVTLRSKGNEAIAGKAKITPSMEENPTCEMTGTDKSIRLTCTEPVTISSDANAPTDFWIVVPPVTLAEGFTVTVENNMGNTQMYEVNQSFTFERNKYYDMTREVEIQNIKTVHVAEAGTLPSLISEEEKYQITEIKITGNLNGTDFKFIREMIGLNGIFNMTSNPVLKTEGKLIYLDLSDSYVIEGGESYFTIIDNSLNYYIYTKNNQFPANFLGGPSTNIQTIMIPHSVNSIGSSAFGGCTALTSVNIPNGVTTIEGSAFYKCSALTEIEIPKSVTTIGSSAFEGCSSLTKIDIPDGVTTIESEAFYGCSALTSINIPDGVTSIGQYAFYGCSTLTSINIPDGVTTIESHAFSGCSALTSINIPDGVTTIEYYAFSDCSALTSINIPNGVTTIEGSAFYKCSALTEIEIPNSVTTIKNYAFSDCSALTSIYCYATTPPTIDDLSFRGVGATLYVPKGCKESYQSSKWNDYFTNITEMEE